MKFMKLGSKPDLFQSGGDNTRYVASELAADLVIKVGNVRFYLHKFPLLSKSSRLQKLVAGSNEDARDEINIPDIPGGHAAFEICAKFCYGMTVTLNAYNVVATRCAAEYLEMNEAVDKGNLVYKVHVFLTSSVFRNWKDSIIVLQTTRSFLPWSEELKIVSHCLDSIALKATVDPSKVEWSYTYNRKDGLQNLHPDDWWVEDLCDLHIDLFKKVITSINSKGVVSADVIAEALKAYAHRRLPGFSKGTIQGADPVKYGLVINTIISLLPAEKNSAPCSFLLRLLQASMAMDCAEETQKKELIRRIGSQLDEATVNDLAQTDYDTDIVRDIVEQFVGVFASDASKAKVAALIDGYLTEVAKDPNLDLSKFVDLADMVSGFPRPSHDQIYRAIDMYLKEHPGISKSERKRICRLMDCRKLSVEACMHAVQNERLPLRVVVQVLFFEQVRAATSSDEGSASHLPGGPHGSSRTTTDEDWDAVPTAEEFSALKLREDGVGSNDSEVKRSAPKEVGGNKVKMSKKILAKMWSNKERQCENSSSDTSGSPASRSRRHSLS